MKKLFFCKFSKYIYGGFISYSLRLGLTTFLTEILDIWYFVSYIVALSSATLFNFFFNIYITFKVQNKKTKRFMKYLVTVLIFYFLDAAAVRVLTEIVNLHYLFSIFLVTSTLLILKFFTYNKLIFC